MSDIIRFDGDTINQERDAPRLHRQLNAVRQRMECGSWMTLQELASELSFPEPSISARIRDLRKDRFGARYVERRYRGRGLYEYKLHPKEGLDHV